MLDRNTRESALRREEFHRALQQWLDDSYDEQVGDPDSHAGSAWLWVRHGGQHYYLNGDATRSGVREYLRAVGQAGGEPEWHLPHTSSSLRDRVAIGSQRTLIDGFAFYRHVPGR